MIMSHKKKIYQPIFSRSRHIDRMAFMNWRFSGGEDDFRFMINIAEGYVEASISLIDTCLTDNKDKKADIFILPIFMAFNHGIEIYLKGLISLLDKIQKIDVRISGNHDIKQLYDTLKSKLKTYDIALWKEYKDTNTNLENYIKELYDKINNDVGKPGMDFSRYPFDKTHENHFYVGASGNMEVDLDNLLSRIRDIHGTLDNLSNHLYYNVYLKEW